MSTALDRYIALLEGMNVDNVGALSDYVTADVHFRDPFNDVRGPAAMEAVFRDMFESVADIRFVVTHRASKGNHAMIAWHFSGRLKSGPWRFEGASLLRLAADSRIAEHFDYWDAGGALYERLPVIGWILKRVRRRLRAA